MRNPNTWLELKPGDDLEMVVTRWKARLDAKNRSHANFMETGINKKGTLKNR
jgi:uncharacterized protein (DUF2237 family)